MTSAMTPPMQNQTKLEIRYMYPMVLWSVEVIQVTRTLPLRSAERLGAVVASETGVMPGRFSVDVIFVAPIPTRG